MLKYLGGEVYRLFHKRSMYLYFGILAIVYVVLVFVRSGNLNEFTILSDADAFFGLLPPFVGGFLFAAIYTDDLSSKNLTTLVGFGVNKVQIVLAKFLLMVLFSVLVYACVVLLTYVAHAVFGWPASLAIMQSVCTYATSPILITVSFAALASIAVYGLQRTTFAIVLYLLLTLGVISQLLSFALTSDFVSNLLPGLETHLMSGIALRIQLGAIVPELELAVPIVEYIVYVVVALAAAIVAFYRKEMEF